MPSASAACRFCSKRRRDTFKAFAIIYKTSLLLHQGTIGGPTLYVGNYGMPVFTEGDTIDDDVLFRRADDLDGDGIWGDILVVTPNGIGHIVRLRRPAHVQHLLR